MKAGRKIPLVLSHLALIAIGWGIGSAFESKPTSAEPEDVARRTPPSRATESDESNPILRARGADYRAAWEKMMRSDRSRSGELQGFSISFFVDWSAVDPDGAVLGLSQLYTPRFGHNYLSNAVNAHGAELAPALVKHWRKLVFQQSYKLSSQIGIALQKLAKEDPVHAAGLMAQLPPGMRSENYERLFNDLARQDLESLFARIPKGAEIQEKERVALWQAFANQLEISEPDSGVAEWIAKIDDPQARSAFVEVAVRKSMRIENWDDFLDTIDALDSSEQTAIINDVLSRPNPFRTESAHRTKLLQSCEARGLEVNVEPIQPDR